MAGSSLIGPRIRTATPADVPAIARIWHEGWADGHAGHVPEELYRHRTAETYPPRVLERIGQTWLAERDGVALGFVVVIDDEVEQVYVDGAARGTGVATMLLEKAECVVAETGRERAWLAVVAGNARARAFYERSGWRDAGAFDYEAETAAGFVLVPCRRYEKHLRGR
ncbi:GNAT family N-acetyltransferase [Agromyces sp. NPDC049794]|uniref:GNAT family N-acetyltransferase n=1 Tax=unclassified Agromyces TaxID=2639701 RepID=UPI003401E746